MANISALLPSDPPTPTYTPTATATATATSTPTATATATFTPTATATATSTPTSTPTFTPTPTGTPIPSGPVTINYIYDPLNRLTEANYSTGDTYHYSYDAVGNRLTQNTLLSGVPLTTSYLYDDANRLTSVNGVTYTWDDNGNLLNDGVNTYTYDSANRLKTFSGQGNTSTYAYNGLGDRIQETINGQTTTFTMDLNTGLTQALSDGTNNYIYGLDRIAQAHDTTTEYFLDDALGSVRQLTNNTGVITYARRYDPYGVVTQTTGSSQTAYGYTGEFTSNDMLYLRARYYTPGVGRFLTRDSWMGDTNRPLSLNKWAYVEENPINLTDPTGQFPFWCKSMSSRIDYEDCVRDFYNLSAPQDYSILPQELQEGEPGCWRGPVSYDAPGYLEGAAVSAAAIADLTYSLEVVYNFATMEKQHFDVIQLGASTQVGASLNEYQGIVFNFNNVESLGDRYRGPFLYGSGGAGTGFPGVAQLNTGATYFGSTTNDVKGLSQYYSFSIGFGGVPALLGQFSLEVGFGIAVPMEKFNPYILLPSGRVNVSQLVSDITLGKDSWAIVPMPSVLVRGIGIELAIHYARIHDEIYVNSK